MIVANLQEKKTARIKFFAAYAVSVLLVIVMFAALWKNEPQVVKSYVAAAPEKTDKTNSMQAYTFLHAKLQSLDDLYAQAAKSNITQREAAMKNVTVAEAGFTTSLDSLEREAIALKDEQQKTELNSVVTKFRNTVEARTGFMANYFSAHTDTVFVEVANTTADNTIAGNNGTIEELKKILFDKEQRIAGLEKQVQTGPAEKDKIISALRTQLAQKPAVPVQNNSAGNDGEWKKKYSKLKATSDNLAAENRSLKKSFGTIVEDNRRLLAQVQAAKKQ